MIFVRHHTTAPRKLASRFSQPIPTNPRQSWQGFDGKQELKDNLLFIQNGLCAYCEIRLDIKPTNNDCERYFSFDLFGKVIPKNNLTTTETIKAQNTIDVLNLNCKRLKRQREAVLEEGFEIINELLDNSEALNYFLDLELNSVNNNYFSFINLRREHFKQFKI